VEDVRRSSDWQVVLLLAPIALELLRQGSARWSHRLFFYTPPGRGAMLRSCLLATVLCVATPIKIWNNARIEHRLQEQEKLLLAAEDRSARDQINPHFLFNTTDLDFVAHPHAAGDRADADYETVRHCSAAIMRAPKIRHVRESAGID
jgi:hypothetical protein